MAIFPRIQSPCPYQGELPAILDGRMCRLCKREVIDLDGMDDGARVAFLGACKQEVCVSYSLPVRTALAAAALVAASAAPVAAAASEAVEVDIEYIVVVGGGIKDPSKVEYFDDEGETASALPVVYEDARADAPESTTGLPAPTAEATD